MNRQDLTTLFASNTRELGLPPFLSSTNARIRPPMSTSAPPSRGHVLIDLHVLEHALARRGVNVMVHHEYQVQHFARVIRPDRNRVMLLLPHLQGIQWIVVIILYPERCLRSVHLERESGALVVVHSETDPVDLAFGRAHKVENSLPCEIGRASPESFDIQRSAP